MKTFHVYIDAREKKPLRFPDYINMLSWTALPHERRSERVQIKTHSITLPFADYALKECEEAGVTYSLGDGIVFETKRSAEEVAGNLLTTERKRQNFDRVLTYLASLSVSGVIMEGTPSTVLAPTGREPSPELALDALLRVCCSRRVPFHLIPGGTNTMRLKTAELIARVLINGAMSHAPEG